MRTISAGTFEKFTGKSLDQFLPITVKKDDIEEVEVEISSLASLVVMKADFYHNDGSLGVTHNFTHYHGICEGGTVLSSPEPNFYSSSSEAHSRTVKHDGVAIGEAWANDLEKLKFVVKYESNYDNWEGGHNFINCHSVTLFLLRNDDKERISKIRRRCEDALRKSDATTVLRIASILGVKFD